jgi:hypothetical protein
MTAPTHAAALVTHQLADLASLEIAIELAMRAAAHTYPALSKVQCPNEPHEIATARDFVDQCELLLAALNAHWNVLATALPDECPVQHDDHDIPF